MVRTKQTSRNVKGHAPRKQLREKHDAPKGNDTNAKKPHRFHPGTVAIREIKKQQKSVKLNIPKAPFRRLVREIAQDFKSDLRFTKSAFDAIHAAAEAELVRHSQRLCLTTIHRKHQTIEPVDSQFLRALDAINQSAA